MKSDVDRTSRRSVRLSRARRCALLCCAPAVLFYAISLELMTLSGFTLVESLRDLAQQTGQSSFLGFLSSIGTWLWVAAAALCLFGWRLNRENEMRDGPEGLLLGLGIFSLVLAVDDFFLIHDRYIAEGILLPLYALFTLWLARRHWPLIGAIDRPSFLITGALLALSVAVDALQEVLPVPYGWSQIAEEGFKFVGAAAWLYFCAQVAAFGLIRAVGPR